MSRWSTRRWLDAFRANGGVAWRYDGNQLGLVYRVHGWTLEQTQRCRQLCLDIEAVPDRFIAIALQVAWSG